MRKKTLLLIFALIFHATSAFGIDLEKIIHIESRGNAKAYNKKSKATGLCQITPICLEDYNIYHPKKKFTMAQMFDSKKNKIVARWYLDVRIPQMLKHYKKEVSDRNILISYNAGISYVIKEKKLPKETVNYIKQYEKKEAKK